MRRFLALDLNTQQLAMSQAAAAKGLALVAVEKDFWVCWTLSQLFTLKDNGQHLTFKGGTSLSKVWALIQRFSEDIDLVMDKAWLGFEGDKDPEKAPSKEQQKKRIQALRSHCASVVAGPLQAALAAAFHDALPAGRAWSLELDPEDRERQTLRFAYPRLAIEGAGYLKPWVKIELGARSDIHPAVAGSAVSEIASVFPQLFDGSSVQLRVLGPERTFLEKVTLLHEESFRPPDPERRRTQKLARHYYDVARLIQAGVGQRALEDAQLFERVVAHRRVYFRQGWVDYDTMTRGTLRLVPDAARKDEWARDYAAMQREMFYGVPPVWAEVMQAVTDWEYAFNRV